MFGTSATSRRNPAPTASSRTSRLPPPSRSRIAPSRLLVEISIDCLLVARWADAGAVREAHHRRVGLHAVNGAHELRPAFDAPPVLDLARHPPEWGDAPHAPKQE